MAGDQVISVLRAELPFSLLNREVLQQSRPSAIKVSAVVILEPVGKTHN
ncbi:MAG: hypothetical protein ACE5FK_04980 [Candidatus Methylomirabilia bacterium]